MGSDEREISASAAHRSAVERRRTRRLVGRAHLIAALWLVGVGVRPAHAYMSPDTLDLALQLILGGAAALVVVLIVYWRQLLRLFGIGSADKPSSGDGESDA